MGEVSPTKLVKRRMPCGYADDAGVGLHFINGKLADLYRATQRTEKAEKLERRAERIRAMKR